MASGLVCVRNNTKTDGTAYYVGLKNKGNLISILTSTDIEATATSEALSITNKYYLATGYPSNFRVLVLPF